LTVGKGVPFGGGGRGVPGGGGQGGDRTRRLQAELGARRRQEKAAALACGGARNLTRLPSGGNA